MKQLRCGLHHSATWSNEQSFLSKAKHALFSPTLLDFYRSKRSLFTHTLFTFELFFWERRGRRAVRWFPKVGFSLTSNARKFSRRKRAVFGNNSRHRIDQCFTNFPPASLARNDLVLVINFKNSTTKLSTKNNRHSATATDPI